MRLRPRQSRPLPFRLLRSCGSIAAMLLLVIGTAGLRPGLGGSEPERAPWSKCGLALCSCLQPVPIEPDCPLCPGYDESATDGPQETPADAPMITVRYDASMQLPMSLLVCSMGLVVVLGGRDEDEGVDPETELKFRPTTRIGSSRFLSIETPPPRG